MRKALVGLGWAAVFVLLAAMASPALAQSGKPAAGPYLAGQFLVATPELPDPRFQRTVVYMVEHNKDGALGLIVNRVYGSGPLGTLLEGLGLEAGELGDGGEEVRLHYGGPVEPSRAFVLHSADFKSPKTLVVSDGISMTAERGVFEAIASGTGPEKALVALGYAGWSPGQLEAEIERGDWLSAPADEAVIFDADIDSKWQRATDGAGLRL